MGHVRRLVSRALRAASLVLALAPLAAGAITTNVQVTTPEGGDYGEQLIIVDATTDRVVAQAAPAQSKEDEKDRRRAGFWHFDLGEGTYYAKSPSGARSKTFDVKGPGPVDVRLELRGGGGSPGGPSTPAKDQGSILQGNFSYFGVQPKDAERPGFPIVTSQRLVLVDNPVTGRPFQGELSGPSAQTLYDDDQTGYPFASGFNGDVGGWFGRESRFGLELRGLYVPETTTTQAFRSRNENSFLSVPYFNTALNSEYSVVIGSMLTGSPASSGIVDIGSSIDFWGIGGGLQMRDMIDCDDVEFEFVAGFRYLSLNERFWIDYDTDPSVNTFFGQGTLASYLFAGGTAPAFGSRIHAQDDVQTENDFYGLDLGVTASVEMLPNLTVKLAPTIALGAMVQDVKIFGSGMAWQPNGPMLRTPYGVFTRPGGVGSWSETEFAVVPQIDLEFSYEVGHGISLFAGYSFLYVSSYASAGDQLDRRIDAPIGPTGSYTASPRAASRPELETTDFWANGVNLGVRFTF